MNTVEALRTLWGETMRSLRSTAAALIVLVLSISVVSAQQVPAPPAAQAAAGVISGRLVGVEGQPVRKAQVRVVHSDRRTTRTATSDADGLFSLTDVPPGEYTLSATRSGYLDTVYGARRPGLSSRGTPIRLVANQKTTDITLRMMRGSVITGTVIDEFGDPAYNVPVRAMRFYYDNGFRGLTSGGNGTTDDRGMYRIAGLPPGEYLVSAVPRDTVAAGVAAAEAGRDRQAQIAAAAKTAGKPAPVLPVPPAPPPLGYVPIYYPGTPLGATAGTVRVGASEEVPGINIRLQVIQTVTVAGRITSSEGTIPQSRLQLIDASLPINGVGIWFRDMRSDGTFSFSGVVPGSYIVKAHGTPGGQAGVAGGEMWSSVDVHVDTRGAEGVDLRMQRGVTLSGQIALDALPPTVNRSGVRLSLYPISSPTDWEMGIIELAIGTDGQFTARNVLPAHTASSYVACRMTGRSTRRSSRPKTPRICTCRSTARAISPVSTSRSRRGGQRSRAPSRTRPARRRQITRCCSSPPIGGCGCRSHAASTWCKSDRTAAMRFAACRPASIVWRHCWIPSRVVSSIPSSSRRSWRHRSQFNSPRAKRVRSTCA